jgi:hypothetical protein
MIALMLPRVLRVLLAAFVCLLAGSACAETFDFMRDRQPLASLDGKWRLHPGDSPASLSGGAPKWAQPGFDDSTWPLLDSDRPWYDQGYNGMSGWAWYLFSVKLPAAAGPLTLKPPPITTAYEIFADGRSLSPGPLLQRLNAEMTGSQDGGFITCLCVHIAADGAAILANAGHLLPYRNGEEVPAESGLPLGIVAAAEYAEMRLKLAPGETLTLMSDGVVEARNAAGELFGFARTRAISGDSAEKIAQAAQAFGQEDDITVVTLTLLRAEAAHA